MKLAVIREGKALLYIPDTRPAVDPLRGSLEPAWLQVFYNPSMELNRDLSVQFLNAYAAERSPLRSAIDVLAGTGVRGLRYLLEVGGLERAVLNDIDEEALKLIKANINLNSLGDRAVASNRDANALLYTISHELGGAYDIVDLDPFGSPAPFISAAISVASRGGVLAATATDLAVLGGSKRLAAKRKYWLDNPPGPTRGYREVALRVLLGFIAREAASHDKAVRPLFSVSVGHYARVFVTFDKGSQKAYRSLENNMGCIRVQNGVALMQNGLPSDSCYGPIWTGPLWDKEIVDRMLNDAKARKYEYQGCYADAFKVLSLIEEELSLQEFPHQRLDELCSEAKHNMPALSVIRARLTSQGYRFSRTHLSPIGFRTDAPPDAILEACKSS
ncbi:N2,N2-dimethylguanosine tRNA methyltransferase [Acidilobus saccharovorans 345-15]|uniref:tRNA (guanine(26)-N(2))-dimethyltransferase n=1 Tax=Acidilobus saccharovorans (strain DSM 16705 / JCM 18335 / VKM B-2471 / 345-15) TaxID=666510 RepID=D9PZY2_ACIS3|nr:tRNA (guanine(26)-N(2))-dimethyltransferase [Acidilobus saccharovorans]ADL18620.1 N2,N2-dimethylguanosine tRNA methyltransferase [Acidilobus saccharovorans 345-15]